jgi:MinD superfamily P-loop ATPase
MEQFHQYSFTEKELDRIDAEMGEMYFDCPKCGFCQRLGNVAKAVLNRNPLQFRNTTCSKCGHQFDAGPRMKFGDCPGFDYSKSKKKGE